MVAKCEILSFSPQTVCRVFRSQRGTPLRGWVLLKLTNHKLSQCYWQPNIKLEGCCCCFLKKVAYKEFRGQEGLRFCKCSRAASSISNCFFLGGGIFLHEANFWIMFYSSAPWTVLKKSPLPYDRCKFLPLLFQVYGNTSIFSWKNLLHLGGPLKPEVLSLSCLMLQPEKHCLFPHEG